MVYVSLLCILTIWQLTKRASCTDTIATTETASLETSVTISVASESSTTESLFARTASKLGHRMASRTRGDTKLRQRRKHTRTKSPRERFRLLEPPDPCLIWSPSLNVTAGLNYQQLTVDYCQSEGLPIPNTYTCVRNMEITMCTVVESPRCGHVFENLTTGNYTIIVKPLCKSCFDVEIYNSECITPIYTKNINLEEMTGDNSLVEKKQSNSTHSEVIVPASCASAILVFIFVVIYVMAKCRNCAKSFSCGRRNTITSQTLPDFTSRPAADDQTKVERSQNAQHYYHEQETIFTNTENSTETEAMLPNSHGLLQEQAPSDSEEQSYPYKYGDTSPSMMTLNSSLARFKNRSSCQTISTSSVDICDMQATDQESSPSENDRRETLQGYFDTDTGINNIPARLLPVPRIMDVPYNLVFTDT